MKPTETLSRNTEAVADSLAAMIERELTTYTYCNGYLDPSDTTIITADDREKLVDWCYAVVDHCRYSRETVASTMEMVDRFLSMPSNSADAARVSDEALRDQTKFQLLTIAALYISIKVNEKIVTSSDMFVEMCSRAYTADEIEDMERTLLSISGLSWQCHAPTAHQVGLSILSLLLPHVDIPEVTWGFLIDDMKHLTELAVRDYYFSTQRASTIALAAIFNVISDTSTKERRELFGAFSRVIMGCFDFDDSKQIAAAKARLSLLSKPETVPVIDSSEESGPSVGLNTSTSTNTTCLTSSLTSSEPEGVNVASNTTLYHHESSSEEATPTPALSNSNHSSHGNDDHPSCKKSGVFTKIIKSLRLKSKEDNIERLAFVDPNQNSAFVVDTSAADDLKIMNSRRSGSRETVTTGDWLHQLRSSTRDSAHTDEIHQSKSHSRRGSAVDDEHREHPKKSCSLHVDDRRPSQKSSSFFQDDYSGNLAQTMNRDDTASFLDKECRRHQTSEHHRRRRSSSRTRSVWLPPAEQAIVHRHDPPRQDMGSHSLHTEQNSGGGGRKSPLVPPAPPPRPPDMIGRSRSLSAHRSKKVGRNRSRSALRTKQ